MIKQSLGLCIVGVVGGRHGREPDAGAVSVAESGTIIGTLISRGAPRGLGFNKLVSVGNESDLGVGELVELLAADPETRSILLFLACTTQAWRRTRNMRCR